MSKVTAFLRAAGITLAELTEFMRAARAIERGLRNASGRGEVAIEYRGAPVWVDAEIWGRVAQFQAPFQGTIDSEEARAAVVAEARRRLALNPTGLSIMEFVGYGEDDGAFRLIVEMGSPAFRPWVSALAS